MKENHKPPLFSLQKKPWEENDNSVWLASTVSLRRNIEKYKFPGKLPNDRRKQLITHVGKEILEAKPLLNPKLYKGEELSPVDKEFLTEHFLTIQSYHQAHAGEAFILDESGTFLVSLNIGDHIYMQLIDCKGEIESAWTKLVKLETALGQAINFCFSPRFGFLTSDLTLCGTAFEASVFLQVPGLIHTGVIDDVLEKIADDSLTITGIQGNPTEVIGDILVIKNNYTLGITEENILSGLRTFTTQLLVEENGSRSKIRGEDNPDIKDKVSRAYGILIHSYQIEAIESLNALSLLKLGSEFGWVKGISVKELNELFFNCRRAHLLGQFSQTISQEEIPHKRAEFIHAALKNAQLTI